MKFTRLFFLSVFFVLGCCFYAAATETFQVDGELVAMYTFVESEEVGTGLIIDAHTSMDNVRMIKFGEFISEKCKKEQIDLRVLGTRNLIYSFTKDSDLIIEANGKCSDFNLHQWALIALGVGEFKICYEKPYAVAECCEETAPSQADYSGSKEEVPYYEYAYRQSKKIRDIIIKDDRISAAEYYDSSRPGNNGWFRFTYQAPDFCRNLVLAGRVYPHDIIPQVFCRSAY